MSSRSVSRKIIFITPYPFDTAPGQRFRYEQYLHILRKEGFEIHLQSFLSESAYASLYLKGKLLQKIFGVILGFIRRIIFLPSLIGADFVFIFREASPVGPPVFEWFISKILRKKIIYDFDDAIWMTDNNQELWIEKLVRWRSKVALICKWSYKVSCGNQYLCDYAKRYNQQVVLNPTTIDTETLHNPGLYTKAPSSSITIGWTGSHSTLKYLKEIEDTLQQIEQEFPTVQFLVIANKKPDLHLNRLLFIPWRKETEAVDLLKIDIGIMPLPEDEWTKGKCGFKALQYMAMEIPSVVSAVGVNQNIINHGINGFLSTTHAEWFNYLTELLRNEQLRTAMGRSGRKKIVENYSVASNSPVFLSLFS